MVGHKMKWSISRSTSNVFRICSKFCKTFKVVSKLPSKYEVRFMNGWSKCLLTDRIVKSLNSQVCFEFLNIDQGQIY